MLCFNAIPDTPKEKAEKHGRETYSESARPCTPDAVQEA